MFQRHPRRQLRWRLGRLNALKLVLLLLAVELFFAATLALLFVLSSGDQTMRDWLPTFFVAFGAVLGAGSLEAARDNIAQQVLGAVASIIGTLTPAILVGIALIRIFTVQPIRWRSKMNVCTVADLRHDLPALANLYPDHARIIQIRFYRTHARGLRITDLRATAELRYSIYSKVDGSAFFRSRGLKVIDKSGKLADERCWSLMATSMPFSLYIPVDLPVANTGAPALPARPVADQLTQVQGVPAEVENLTSHNLGVSVNLQGKIIDLNLELNTEHRYSVTTDVQRGRPVSVDPPPGYLRRRDDERKWMGWARFDHSQEYGLFVYGPQTHCPDPSEVIKEVPAELVGYASSCGEDGSTRLVESESDRVAGRLLFVSVNALYVLDARLPEDVRHNITKHVIPPKGVQPPDVVWAFVSARPPAG